MKIAIISDIHGNLTALNTVLEEIGDMRILCCGDIVGYNPWPNEVIEIVINKKIASVMGNHDFATVIGNTSDFNPIAARAIEWTIEKIMEDNIEFLKSLPLKYNDENFVIVHGSPRDQLNEYVYPEHPYIESFLEDITQDILILGHTHIPFVKRFSDKVILNPGSVGQPRDGNPYASYAILDAEKKEVDIKRVKYDIEEVADRIIKECLPVELAMRLFHGF